MIVHVHLLEYNLSLLGDMNWGAGSFARSHNPTAVYMTFFPNCVIQKFFPGVTCQLNSTTHYLAKANRPTTNFRRHTGKCLSSGD